MKWAFMCAQTARAVLPGLAGELTGGRDQVGMGVEQTECALLVGVEGFLRPLLFLCGHCLARLQPRNSPGLPGCAGAP